MRLQVKNIKRVKRAGGEVHLYHQKTGERLPDNLQAAAARALEINVTLDDPGKALRGAGTFGALATEYLVSPEFAELAERTKTKYRRDIEAIRQGWGALRVAELKKPTVVKLRNKLAATPAKANHRISVLSVLINYGQALDEAYGDVNPTLKVKKLKTGGYISWPDNAISDFKDAAPADIRRLIIGGCLGTGQRVGTVIEINWNNVRGDRLVVGPAKRGNPVDIPIVAELRDALDEIERSALVVFTNGGRPWTYRAALLHTQKVLDEIGFPELTPHGLRFAAARRLFASGATLQEVAACTGHRTAAMALEYAERADAATRAMGRI